MFGFIRLFGRREITEHPTRVISAFGASQPDTRRAIGNAAFSSSKASVFHAHKYPQDINCFSLHLAFVCVFADKLMEETEELCLQREQKEVSVHHKPIPFIFHVAGLGGSGVVGLRAHQVSGREAVEPKESPANLWALWMKRGIRPVPWGGSWKCIPAPLPTHFLCSMLVIMS